MVNILLENADLTADYLADELRGYLKKGMRVVIVAFSFDEKRVKDIDDWRACYDKEFGKYYGMMVEPFGEFGIGEDDIEFVNWFCDTPETALAKIKNADVVYFPGGLPDRIAMRIDAWGLRGALVHFDGVMMGFSAGALIQMKDYHISPDDDYPEFAYFKGLPLLEGFYLEVHYENNDTQNAGIRRALAEKKLPVYATVWDRGALIFDNGKMKILGDVKKFV